MYEMECPKCGGTIDVDECDNVTGDHMTNFCYGHCIKCKSEYQWREEYVIDFEGITDFEEVS